MPGARPGQAARGISSRIGEGVRRSILVRGQCLSRSVVLQPGMLYPKPLQDQEII